VLPTTSDVGNVPQGPGGAGPPRVTRQRCAACQGIVPCVVVRLAGGGGAATLHPQSSLQMNLCEVHLFSGSAASGDADAKNCEECLHLNQSVHWMGPVLLSRGTTAPLSWNGNTVPQWLATRNVYNFGLKNSNRWVHPDVPGSVFT